jgi:hypothetical protein
MLEGVVGVSYKTYYQDETTHTTIVFEHVAATNLSADTSKLYVYLQGIYGPVEVSNPLHFLDQFLDYLDHQKPAYYSNIGNNLSVRIDRK